MLTQYLRAGGDNPMGVSSHHTQGPEPAMCWVIGGCCGGGKEASQERHFTCYIKVVPWLHLQRCWGG
jgi:hypothetical protein